MNEDYKCNFCQKGKVRPLHFSLKQASITCDNIECESYLEKWPWECVITTSILEPSNLYKYEKESECSSDSSGVHSDLGSSNVSPSSLTDREVELLLHNCFPSTAFREHLNLKETSNQDFSSWHSMLKPTNQEPFVALDNNSSSSNEMSSGQELKFESNLERTCNEAGSSQSNKLERNENEFLEMLKDISFEVVTTDRIYSKHKVFKDEIKPPTCNEDSLDNELESWLQSFEHPPDDGNCHNRNKETQSPSKALIPSTRSAFSEVSPSKIDLDKTIIYSPPSSPSKRDEDEFVPESLIPNHLRNCNSFLSSTISGCGEDSSLGEENLHPSKESQSSISVLSNTGDVNFISTEKASDHLPNPRLLEQNHKTLLKQTSSNEFPDLISTKGSTVSAKEIISFPLPLPTTNNTKESTDLEVSKEHSDDEVLETLSMLKFLEQCSGPPDEGIKHSSPNKEVHSDFRSINEPNLSGFDSQEAGPSNSILFSSQKNDVYSSNVKQNEKFIKVEASSGFSSPLDFPTTKDLTSDLSINLSNTPIKDELNAMKVAEYSCNTSSLDNLFAKEDHNINITKTIEENTENSLKLEKSTSSSVSDLLDEIYQIESPCHPKLELLEKSDSDCDIGSHSIKSSVHNIKLEDNSSKSSTCSTIHKKDLSNSSSVHENEGGKEQASYPLNFQDIFSNSPNSKESNINSKIYQGPKASDKHNLQNHVDDHLNFNALMNTHDHSNLGSSEGNDLDQLNCVEEANHPASSEISIGIPTNAKSVTSISSLQNSIPSATKCEPSPWKKKLDNGQQLNLVPDPDWNTKNNQTFFRSKTLFKGGFEVDPWSIPEVYVNELNIEVILNDRPSGLKEKSSAPSNSNNLPPLSTTCHPPTSNNDPVSSSSSILVPITTSIIDSTVTSLPSPSVASNFSLPPTLSSDGSTSLNELAIPSITSTNVCIPFTESTNDSVPSVITTVKSNPNDHSTSVCIPPVSCSSDSIASSTVAIPFTKEANEPIQSMAAEPYSALSDSSALVFPTPQKINIYKPVTLRPEVLDSMSCHDNTITNFKASRHSKLRLSVGYSSRHGPHESSSNSETEEAPNELNKSSSYFDSILSNLDFDDNFCMSALEEKESSISNFVGQDLFDEPKFDQVPSPEKARREETAPSNASPPSSPASGTEDISNDESSGDEDSDSDDADIPIVTIDSDDELDIFIPVKQEAISDVSDGFSPGNCQKNKRRLSNSYEARSSKRIKPSGVTKNSHMPCCGIFEMSIPHTHSCPFSSKVLFSHNNSNTNTINLDDSPASKSSEYNVSAETFTMFKYHELFGNLKKSPEYYDYSDLNSEDSYLSFIFNNNGDIREERMSGIIPEIDFPEPEEEIIFSKKQKTKGKKRKNVRQSRTRNKKKIDKSVGCSDLLEASYPDSKKCIEPITKNMQPLQVDQLLPTLGPNSSTPDVLKLLKDTGWAVLPCNPTINYSIPSHAKSPTVVPAPLQDQYGNTGSDVVLWTLTDEEVPKISPSCPIVEASASTLVAKEGPGSRALVDKPSERRWKGSIKPAPYNDRRRKIPFLSQVQPRRCDQALKDRCSNTRFIRKETSKNLLESEIADVKGLKTLRTSDGSVYVRPSFVKKEPIDSPQVHPELEESSGGSDSEECIELPDDFLAYEEIVKDGYDIGAPPTIPKCLYIPPPSPLKTKVRAGPKRPIKENLRPCLSSQPPEQRVLDATQMEAEKQLTSIVSQRPASDVPDVVCMTIEGKLYVYHRKDAQEV